MKLLYDCVSGNPGDVAIGQVELAYFRSRGHAIEAVGPDYEGKDTLIIGGGHLLQPPENPFHYRFRREGPHVLCAMGVSEGLEGLHYLFGYQFVSVRTIRDAQLLQDAGGPAPEVIPCPANLIEPEDSGIDASGMIGIQTSAFDQAEALGDHVRGRVLAFPWRRNLGGLMDHDDLECAERVAMKTGGEVLPTGLTPGQLMDVIRQLDLFICQTLHGAIWAYQAGVNFLVHGYVPKVLYWAEERGLSYRVFDRPDEIGERLRWLAPHYPIAWVDRERAAAGLERIADLAGERAGGEVVRERTQRRGRTRRWPFNRAPGGDRRAGARSAPLVSIVIPAYNNLELTERCIESVQGNTGEAHEVIVVDNGSTDGTADFLKEADCDVISSRKNEGFPRAANKGIAAARGEFVCLLNNDTVVLPGWLPPLLECHVTHPRTGVAGPRQVRGGRIWHAGTIFTTDDCPGFPRRPLHIYLDYSQEYPLAGVERDYPAMNFGCALIRRGLFDEIGPLDDETFAFPGFYEDVDWCLRARKTGYECRYVPSSRIIHEAGSTHSNAPGELAESSRRAVEVNLARLYEKWRDEPESFFVPPSLRPVVDEYLMMSALFLDMAPTHLAGLTKTQQIRIRELEAGIRVRQAELETARLCMKEAGQHIEAVEADNRARGEEIERAKRYGTRLEQIIAEKDGSS